MKKSFAILLLIMSIALIACSDQNSENINQNVNRQTLENQNAVSENQKTASASFSSQYGYSLSYPETYETDSEYTIQHQLQPEAVLGLIETWGVNKIQESVFHISVYPSEQKQALLDHFNYTPKDERFSLNGQNAQKLSGMGSENHLLVEKQNYIYLITGQFADPAYAKITKTEHQEYLNILNSLKFN